MQEAPEEDVALKRRLLGRILFAVVILSGLLVSLAVFDRMNAPDPLPERIAVRSPELRGASVVPPPTKDVKPVPETDVIKSLERGKDDRAAEVAASDAPAVAEGSATPQAAVPLATPGTKPLTQPATGRHVLMRSPEAPIGAATRSDLARELPARQGNSQAAPMKHAGSPAPTRPLALTEEKPFALQLGVFSDVANAEELRARLEKAGIRASIEARVHVGPFATRAEADAARAKLREMGMQDALLLSMKGRKAP